MNRKKYEWLLEYYEGGESPVLGDFEGSHPVGTAPRLIDACPFAYLLSPAQI
jgi:hypothetical protein